MFSSLSDRLEEEMLKVALENLILKSIEDKENKERWQGVKDEFFDFFKSKNFDEYIENKGRLIFTLKLTVFK